MLKGGSIACLVLILMLLSACGSSSGSSGGSSDSGNNSNKSTDQPNVVSNEPTTVSIMGYAVLSFGDPDLFKKYVQDPVKKKYPNISVTFTKNGGFGKVIASGEVPDIFLYWYADLSGIASLKALVPLDPFMKKYQFDQSSVVPSAWQSVKNMAESDQIMAMPLGFSRPALFYNKDIFDKFGTAYPTGRMTFEQASSLGKKLNRTVDGVRYIGFHPESIFRVEMQRNLPYLDPKTGKMAVNTDDWAKLYTMMKNIYTEQQIPDTDYTDVQANAAWGQSRIAMLAAGQGQANNAYQSKLNWDMLEYPENPEKPGYTWRDDGMLASITPNSKQQDAAFKVLQVIASPEVQKMMSEDGIIPVLNDKNVQSAFGKNSDVYKGKNSGAYFTMKSSPAINVPTIKGAVNTEMNNTFFTNIMGKSEDVNTALRELNDDLQHKYEEVDQK